MDMLIEEMEQRLQRHVTPEEVAIELNITVDEVFQTVREHFASNILSMDEQLQDDESDNKTFSIRDDSIKTPEQEAMQAELIQDLSASILKLNDKEQLVLSLFYTEEMTLTEIGEMLELSTSRISQIHSKALFKLRNLLTEEMRNL